MATILAVDDDDVQRKLVSLVLRQAGFEVQEARNGEEALRCARAGDTSLVLLDIHLPDIDGFEVCRRLKADPATQAIGVLHLTAVYPDSLHWASAPEGGADGYLVQPVHPLVLVATVRAILRGRTAEEALRREVAQRQSVERALRESEARSRSLSEELEAGGAARTRELTASEERLRAVFALTPVAIAMVGADHRYTSVNEAFCAMLGYTEDELRALTYLGVTHPDDVAASLECARAHLERGMPSMVREKRYLAKNGQVVWVRITTSVVRDAAEQPSYFVGIVENITDRRRAEGLASAQAGLLEMIASGAPLPNVLSSIVELLEGLSAGMLGSILLLDEGGERLLHGAAPHLPDAYNRSIHGFPIGPRAGSCGTAAFTGRPAIVEDVETDPRWEGYRELVAAYGLRACWSTPILSRTGRVLGTFALYYREPRLPGEHEWRLIDVATHVASIALERARADEALRKSEARYRTLFENSKDASFIVGRDRGSVDVNQAALDLFGVTREELQGLDALQVFASEVERQWFFKQMKAVGSVRDFEARLRKKDGSEMDCLITASVRRDDAGRVVAHEGMIRDVTAQKAADWANRELSRHLLQVQDEERRRIARELHDSTAQHLAALGMHLAVLGGSAGILGPRGARAVGECHSLVQKCSKEVRTLSYLLHPPLLDEAGLAAALRWFGEGFSARSGIAVALEVPPEMERLPRDAELALFRIVQEALTNVHLHSASPTACIRLRPVAEGVVLEVEDAGRGMPGASAEGAARSSRGLGVGILGMRERVRQLGGELDIVSEGVGTTVRATLPVGVRA